MTADMILNDAVERLAESVDDAHDEILEMIVSLPEHAPVFEIVDD